MLNFLVFFPEFLNTSIPLVWKIRTLCHLLYGLICQKCFGERLYAHWVYIHFIIKCNRLGHTLFVDFTKTTVAFRCSILCTNVWTNCVSWAVSFLLKIDFVIFISCRLWFLVGCFQLIRSMVDFILLEKPSPLVSGSVTVRNWFFNIHFNHSDFFQQFICNFFKVFKQNQKFFQGE